MNNVKQKLLNIINHKDHKILQLQGALDCSNGKPASTSDLHYELGYANQYADEQQRTYDAMELF